jgi:hypothetical protein
MEEVSTSPEDHGAVARSGPILVEVVDLRGVPRSGVTVSVLGLDAWRSECRGVARWQDVRGYTDDRGHCVLSSLKGPSLIRVHDAKDGSAAIQPAGGATCRFVLPRVPPVEVTVLSGDGIPVPDAEVHLKGGALDGGGWFDVRARTGADGVAQIPAPEANGILVAAYHPERGLGRVTLPGGLRRADVILEDGAEARVVIQAKEPRPVAVDYWLVARRDMVLCWRLHGQMESGREKSLGRFPVGMVITLLAMTRDGRAVASDYSPVAGEVHPLLLRPVRSIDLRVLGDATSARDVRVDLTPPLPLLLVTDEFDEDLRMWGDPFGASLRLGGRVRLQAVLLSRSSEAWNVGVREGPLYLDPTPSVFAVSPDEEPMECTVTVGANPIGLAVRGQVLSRGSGKPLAGASVYVDVSSALGLVAIANGDGEYAFQTPQRPPFRVIFTAPRHVSGSTTVVPPDPPVDAVELDAALRPTDSPDVREVSALVLGPDDAVLPGSRCVWALADGTPVGQSVTGPDGRSSPVFVPTGEAVLLVHAPAGTPLRALRRVLHVQENDVFTVAFKALPATGTVLAHLTGLATAEGDTHLFLLGGRTVGTEVHSGEARLTNVPTGRYDVVVRFADGVMWPLGLVDVTEQTTHVYRTLGRRLLLAVRPASEGPPQDFEARLVHGRTGLVLATSRSRAGEAAEWRVAPGQYVAEVWTPQLRGSTRLVVDSRTTRDAVEIPLVERSASIAVPIVLPDDVEVAMLLVRLAGPIVRVWDSGTRPQHGRTRFMCSGLPAGRYEVTVSCPTLGMASVVIDLLDGQVGETPAVRLR